MKAIKTLRHKLFITSESLYIGVLIVLIVLFWNQVLFFGKTLWIGDISRQYYPWYSILYEHLHSLRLPFWINEMGGGYPLLAQGEIGVFYPLNWLLIFLFSKDVGFRLFLPIHFGIASIGSYYFGKTLKLSKSAALFAAITYVYSFFFTARLMHMSIIASASFLPFGLAILEKTISQKNDKLLLWLSIIIALQIIAGHPQIAFISLLTYMCYSIIRLSMHDTYWQTKAMLFFRLIVALFLGIGIAGIQVLPTLELARYSSRIEKASDFIFSYSLPKSQYLTYLFPYFFGISPQNTNIGFTQFGGHYWEFALYIGITSFVLAIIAVFKMKKDIHVRSLFVCFFLFALLAIGGYLSPYRFLVRTFHLPFRVSARFLLPTTLFISMLSGFGLDMVLSRKFSFRFLRIVMIGFLLLVVFFLLVTIHSIFIPVIPTLIINFFKMTGEQLLFTEFQKITSAQLSLTRFEIYLPLIFLMVSLVSIVGYSRRKISKKSFILCVFGLWFIDSYLQGYRYQQFFSMQQVLLPPDFIKTLPSDADSYRAATNNESGSPQLEQLTLQPNLNLVWHIPSINNITPLPLQGHEEYYNLTRKGTILMNSQGITHVISQQQHNDRSLFLITQTPFSFLYANSSAFPHAYMVYDYEVGTNQAEIFSLLQQQEDMLSRLVILDKPIALLPQINTEKNTGVNIQLISAQEIEKKFMVTTKQDGIMVLLDSYYPGWRAFIDGKMVDILRANGIFRAIIVPKGSHEVIFIYVPKTFYYGLSISIVSLIALSIILTVQSKQWKKQQ